MGRPTRASIAQHSATAADRSTRSIGCPPPSAPAAAIVTSAAARHPAAGDDQAARLRGLGVAAASLRAAGAPGRAPRGVLPTLDVAGRAGAGRLGLLRLDPDRSDAARVVVLRDGAVVVARDL